jgi:hypothetical protein
MVAQVTLVEVDVAVVPRDTTETIEVVVEHMDALFVSQGLSEFDLYVGTRSPPIPPAGY